MPMWRPDPTFYPSPKMAMQAPAENLAFVAMLNAKDNGRPRMERVQRLPVPARSASARGTSLPGRAGHQFVAHSYHRHQA